MHVTKLLTHAYSNKKIRNKKKYNIFIVSNDIICTDDLLSNRGGQKQCYLNAVNVLSVAVGSGANQLAFRTFEHVVVFSA